MIKFSDGKHIVVPQFKKNFKKQFNQNRQKKWKKKLYAEEAKVNSIEIKKNPNHCEIWEE